MRHYLFSGIIICVILLFATHIGAQVKVDVNNRVGVGTTTISAAAKFQINPDLDTQARGFLKPVLTTLQRLGITTMKPAGLEVYDSDEKCTFWWDGLMWQSMCNQAGSNSGTVTSVTGTAPIIVTDNTTTPNISLASLGITTGFLADGAVISSKINNNAVTTAKIEPSSSTGKVLTTVGVFPNLSTSWEDPLPDPTSWKLGGNSVSEVKRFGTTTDFPLSIITNNTEKLRIDTDGRLIPIFMDDYTNFALGDQSLNNIDYSYGTVAIGSGAGMNSSNLAGSSAVANTMIGWDSGQFSYNSFGNSYFGAGAGIYLNGGGNVCVGLQSCTPTGSNIREFVNAIGIGNATSVTASNQVRIGNASIGSIGGFQSWTNMSDERFKKNIEEKIPGLPFILKLRPVQYQFDLDQYAAFYKLSDSLRISLIDSMAINMTRSGFLAQEVEKLSKELNYDFSGVDKPKNDSDYYGLRYAEFVVPLVKAVQEQQVIIDTQNVRIDTLTTQLANQQALINELMLRVRALEE